MHWCAENRGTMEIVQTENHMQKWVESVISFSYNVFEKIDYEFPLSMRAFEEQRDYTKFWLVPENKEIQEIRSIDSPYLLLFGRFCR